MVDSAAALSDPCLPRIPRLNTNLSFALVVASIVVVYANALSAGFVYDDVAVLTGARERGTLVAIADLFKTPVRIDPGLASVETRFYRPVFFTYAALAYRLWGARPWAWHLFNVVLHAACACLALLTLRHLFALLPAAALVTCLLWAIHPVQVEAVTYVTGVSYLLAGLFLLLAILITCGVLAPAASRGIRAILAVGAFILSVLSHELGLMTPALVLLVLTASPAIGWGWGHRLDRGRLSAAAAMVAAAAVYLLVRLTVIGAGKSGHLGELLGGIGARLVQAPEILLRYLGLLAMPVRLTVDRSQDLPTSAAALQARAMIAWGLCAFLAWLAVRLWRGVPHIGFGAAWFLAAYFPVSNTLIPVYSVMAERYIYIASLGILAGAVATATSSELAKRHRGLVILLGMALLGAYGARSIARNRDFHDDMVFYLASVGTSPKSSHMWNNLGNSYLDRGNLDQAEQAYRTAVQLNPGNAQAHYNLGNVALRKGHLDEATAFYQEAISVHPDYAPAYFNLGVVAYRLGKNSEAIRWFERSALLAPGRAETHLALGKAYLSVDPHRAAEHLQRFLDLAPSHPEASAARASLRILRPPPR